MTRFLITILTFVSLLFFPWPFSAVLALVSSLSMPFLPLAAGIFADTLYCAPSTGMLPFFIFYGAMATCIALFVRSRLSSDIIRE